MQNPAYVQTMIALASAAFGVVAALAWNSAITALVKQIFGSGGQIVSLFIYAIIITIVAVIVMVQLAKVAERTAAPKA
ncbi:MAG TPA: DUF5654 family protein [Candidatus Limnocylindria bacterium]|jgi:hypothetical protein|nr:DUF5654 family protein [Candidatus Limnocylindria bacterium]